MISKVTKGPDNLVRKMNEIISALNQMTNITGDGAIKVGKTQSGHCLSIDPKMLGPKLAKIGKSGTGTGTEVRRAITTAAAGAGATIVCNLYDSDGAEQTTGDESGITVYCSICGGTALNAAVPRLEDNDDLFVVSLPYSSSANRWYCVSLFQASQDCE